MIPVTPTTTTISSLQERVGALCDATLGTDATSDLARTILRLQEEVAELARAAGVSLEDLTSAVVYGYQKVPGEVPGEAADVLVTLAALAAGQGIDLARLAVSTVAHLETRGGRAALQKKQAEKPFVGKKWWITMQPPRTEQPGQPAWNDHDYITCFRELLGRQHEQWGTPHLVQSSEYGAERRTKYQIDGSNDYWVHIEASEDAVTSAMFTARHGWAAASAAAYLATRYPQFVVTLS